MHRRRKTPLKPAALIRTKNEIRILLPYPTNFGLNPITETHHRSKRPPKPATLNHSVFSALKIFYLYSLQSKTSPCQFSAQSEHDFKVPLKITAEPSGALPER
jgi:hypothetical protein